MYPLGRATLKSLHGLSVSQQQLFSCFVNANSLLQLYSGTLSILSHGGLPSVAHGDVVRNVSVHVVHTLGDGGFAVLVNGENVKILLSSFLQVAYLGAED